MKSLLHRLCVTSLLFFSLICLFSCSLSSSQLPDDGTPRIIDLAGKERALGEFFAEHTLLFLWASWCPECVVELSALNSAKRNLSARDLSIVTVAINDDVASVRECPPVRNATYPVLLDVKDQIRSRYPVTSLPTVYLLDRKGTVLPLVDPEDGKAKNSVSGFREWQSKAGIRAILDSISTGKP